jgi:hypothetical protein
MYYIGLSQSIHKAKFSEWKDIRIINVGPGRAYKMQARALHR